MFKPHFPDALTHLVLANDAPAFALEALAGTGGTARLMTAALVSVVRCEARGVLLGQTEDHLRETASFHLPDEIEDIDRLATEALLREALKAVFLVQICERWVAISMGVVFGVRALRLVALPLHSIQVGNDALRRRQVPLELLDLDTHAVLPDGAAPD
jgi:hypothetical protein